MNKHIAEHNGQTFTRNSKTRTYSYCVVYKPSQEYAENNVYSEFQEDQDRSDFAFCMAPAKYDFSREEHEAQRAEWTAKGYTVEQYIADQKAINEAKLQKRIEAGDFEQFYAAGWTSRLDLAQKLAQKEAFNGREVVILEAKIL